MRLSIILVIISLCSAETFSLDTRRSSVQFEIVTPMGAIIADGGLIGGTLERSKTKTELEVVGRNLSLKSGSISARSMANILLDRFSAQKVLARGTVKADNSAATTINALGQTHRRTIPVRIRELSSSEIEVVGSFPKENFMNMEGRAVFRLLFSRT